MVFGFGGNDYGGDTTGRWKWALIVAGILFVLLVVAMAMGFRFDTIGNRLGITGGPQELVFWKKYNPMIPLRVTRTEVVDRIRFDRYTMLVDMIWINTRVTTASDLYRHILHRGSGEGAEFLSSIRPTIENAGSGSSPSPSPSTQDVLARMPQGLPIRMNPGIVADPVTNDMLIFVDTERDNTLFRESLRIPDIPMDQPFQLALIVTPNMIEVYINCQLEVTKLIKGFPLSMEEGWYGLVGPQPLNAAIQNLRLFAGILGPKDLRGYCKTIPSFPDSVMMQCRRTQ